MRPLQPFVPLFWFTYRRGIFQEVAFGNKGSGSASAFHGNTSHHNLQVISGVTVFLFCFFFLFWRFVLFLYRNKRWMPEPYPLKGTTILPLHQIEHLYDFPNSGLPRRALLKRLTFSCGSFLSRVGRGKQKQREKKREKMSEAPGPSKKGRNLGKGPGKGRSTHCCRELTTRSQGIGSPAIRHLTHRAGVRR